MEKKRSLRVLASLGVMAVTLPLAFGQALAENKQTPAFAAFVKAFAAVSDYRDQIVVHETNDDGSQTEDRTYAYMWKRPTSAKIDIIDGPGKGGGVVWTGGDKGTGHQGGILSGIKASISINDPRATSLRGDTLEVASFEWELKHFLSMPGTLSDSPGPALEGGATTAVTLTVTNPKTNGNVSKDVLYLSNTTHLPTRREQYVGSRLVKTETFKDVKVNNGFTASDFQ